MSSLTLEGLLEYKVTEICSYIHFKILSSGLLIDLKIFVSNRKDSSLAFFWIKSELL